MIATFQKLHATCYASAGKQLEILCISLVLTQLILKQLAILLMAH